MYFLKGSRAYLPPHWGLLLKKRICSLGEQILSFKSTPKFEVIQLAPLKQRIKMFFYCQRVWKTVKCQEKTLPDHSSALGSLSVYKIFRN